MLVNMANNDHDDDLRRHMEAQEQTFRAQQVENIQQMLAQFLNNRNNDNTTGSNHTEEKNLNNEPPKTEKSKESSAIDANVIKDIQAQIASLT